DSMMRRYTGRLETGAMLKTVGKLLLAGIALAGICWLASVLFFAKYSQSPVWETLLVMSITIAVGAATFFGAAYLLRVAEVHDVVDIVRRRLGRGD
ncbi:MAG: hypothetical protein ABI925_06165, partial [Verrucomicrobiota bacterium]